MAITRTETVTEEPGFDGELISLGLVKGKRGHGRERRLILIGAAALDETLALESNSRRIAATFYNAGSGQVQITLGPVDAASIYMDPKDYFQIDYRVPWTGSMYAKFAGASSLIVTEINVKGV